MVSVLHHRFEQCSERRLQFGDEADPLIAQRILMIETDDWTVAVLQTSSRIETYRIVAAASRTAELKESGAQERA